jgi:anti-sigma regulatory factor (Ser/Thr protein kinase)
MVIRSGPAAPLRDDAFQLAGIPTSVRFARKLAKDTLGSWGIDGEAGGRVVQSLSELVTNAIIHACPAVPGIASPLLADIGLIEVRLKWFEAFLVLEVWDPDRPPAGHGRSVPHLVATGSGAPSGRGLAIVEELSDRWGVLPAQVGKTVFALFDLAPSPAKPSAPAAPGRI